MTMTTITATTAATTRITTTTAMITDVELEGAVVGSVIREREGRRREREG